MPKKLLPSQTVPLLVAERLTAWGNCVRAQRRVQRLTAADLASRAGVSSATLKRIEAGDAGVSAAFYLSVMAVLGFLDTAAPPLPPYLQAPADGKRVRLTRTERGEDGDADWF